VKAIELIKRFEGCRLKAYPDPESPRAKHRRATGVDEHRLSGDPWTIGWGCTGPGIEEGVTWTQEHADAELYERAEKLEQEIAALVRVHLELDQEAALLSLCWNIGIEDFRTSTLLRKLNAEDPTVGDEFTRWVHARGEVVPDLVQRREVERSVFLGECSETSKEPRHA
jgi:lysozyme